MKSSVDKPKAASMASSPPSIDPSFVESLAGIVVRHDLTEVVVEQNGLHIKVARQLPAAQVVSAYVPPASYSLTQGAAASTIVSANSSPAEHTLPEGEAVRSPMVGTAYLRPSPESKPFVEVGQSVKVGDRVLLVEAMKTFNEVVATRAGVVASILVKDGQPVEYDQPLLFIA